VKLEDEDEKRREEKRREEKRREERKTLMMMKLCSLTRNISMAYHKLAYKRSVCDNHIDESVVNSLNRNRLVF
jgi:hypothetical protein